MKNMKKLLLAGMLFLVLFSMTTNAQNVKNEEENNKFIKHGIQEWTATNLNVDHFRNGDLLLQASTSEEWVNAGKKGIPAWCYYENNPENGKIYGKLYNWYAISDERGLAPEGWHVPTNSDWRTLVKNLKGVDIAGSKLKSQTDWKSRKGTNDIGFTAIPSGCRDAEGKFKDLGVTGVWWSNSVPVDVKPSDKIYTVKLSDNSIEVSYGQSDKGAGYSVRCEKD
jgi:uncharacterized protein (TIGR02145 family)